MFDIILDEFHPYPRIASPPESEFRPTPQILLACCLTN
jgi:hypothetical protein